MRMNVLFSTAALCMGSLFLEALPRTSIPTPEFVYEDVIGASVSIHDYREKGICVEPAYIREKLIIHNYGHGGASLALSWGSALEAFEYMEIEVLSDLFSFDFGEVAVLGADVTGLTTANLLLDKGYKVHVYANKLPPDIEFDVAEGIWWPSAVSAGTHFREKRAFKRILKNSYKVFKSLARSPEPAYAGISSKTIYAFNPTGLNLYDPVEHLLGDGVHVAVSFDSGSHKNGVTYETFQIDQKAYLASLYEQAEAKGAVFTKTRFTSKEELEDLNENIIINCTGKGSKDLFEDDSVSLIRHQTVSFSPHVEIDYIFRAAGLDSMSATTFYALDDRIVLSGPYQLNNGDAHLDLKEIKSVVEQTAQFFH